MVKGETKNNSSLNPKPRGPKTKIPIKKIQNKDSRRVACTKRREGLFSKTSQFCLLSGAQIAVLATPPSSESYASFYSFGHSSVDDVVSAFLTGTRPVPEDNNESRKDVGVCLTRKDLGLGFWWENDDRLYNSENPEELKDAIDSMTTLLSNLKELKGRSHHDQAFVDDNDDDDDDDDDDLKKNDVVLHNGTQETDQTLSFLQSTCSVDDYLSANFNEISEEQNQILNNALTEGNLDYNLDQAFVDDVKDMMENGTQTLNLQSTCSVNDYDIPANFNEITEEQIFTNCESFCVTDNNNNNALTEGSLDYNQEMDIEQLIDFDTILNSSFDDLVCSHQLDQETAASNLTKSDLSVDDYVPMETTNPTSLCSDDFEGVEVGVLDEDDLCFADFLNGFITS